MIRSINPYNGENLASFEEIDQSIILQKIDKAQEQYLSWSKTSMAHRSTLLNKLGDLLIQQKKSLARIITLEMGKPISESISEIEKCALCCHYYATHASDFLADEIMDSDASQSYVRYDPLGIVLAIMPWNFPFWQVIRFAAPALMAGNVGLLKHASNVPQCAIELEKLFLLAGYPKGAFQTLMMGSRQVETVIANPHVKAITLTGSEKAGAAVASLAGKYLKKCVLELGGSDPFIVLGDVDIEEVAKKAVIARMRNAGQSCIAAKRFVLLDTIHDAFIEAFGKALDNFKIGDPLDRATEIACMARMDLATELQDQVNTSIDMGAKVLYGGQKDPITNAFFEPTILGNLKPGMPAFEQELFGPVASTFKVSSIEEAIILANNTLYGLGASIWTKDIKKGIKIAHQIEAGSTFVNGIVSSDPRLPFGGVKLSGFGRELSHLGIREFTNIKTVWVG